MKINRIEDDLLVELPQNFSLSQTLDCGQCFRWRVSEHPDGIDCYSGVVEGKYLVVSQRDDSAIVLHNTNEKEFDELWRRYFDLDRDYDALKEILSRDAVLSKAIEYCGGIRVLNQPKWEAFCSFIVSQNNNIPRIKSIIERLSERFGLQVGDSGKYSFPAPESIAEASLDELAKLGLGYRAPYISAAARAVASGALCLDAVAGMPPDDAVAELRKIKGVGEKVAKCTLLYGFGSLSTFPVDTWIKKSMLNYPGGLPDFVMPHAGIAQIYLFHYERSLSQKLR